MADGQQIHRRFGLRIEDQVIAQQVLAQCRRRASRKASKLSQRFGRLRWLLEVAPTHARKSTQVGNNGRAQCGQQVVIGEMRVRAYQKFLDGIEPFEEACGELDSVERVSHAPWLIGAELLAWVL